MTKDTRKRMQCVVPYNDDCPFPLENLPWTVFYTDKDAAHRVGVGLGDYVVDLAALSRHDSIFTKEDAPIKSPFTASEAHNVFSQPKLNAYLALPRKQQRQFRAFLQSIFSVSSGAKTMPKELLEDILIPLTSAHLVLPIECGDYSDFCASREHSTNMGQIMFNDPDRPLEKQWFEFPIAYHGRASSLIASGTPIHRPWGLFKPRGVPDAQATFSPTRVLDYELEMAFVIGGGVGNKLGDQIRVEDGLDHVFGMTLMNDWSARDIQGYEMVPLGPFQGKNFATTISPFIVETDALDAFSVAAPLQSPRPLDHLYQKGATQYNIELQALYRSKDHESWTVATDTNYRYMYWTAAQMVAHHTASGCPLRPGDLLGSGTISGPPDHPNSRACLMEKTYGGKTSFALLSDSSEVVETRTFIQDGDTVRFTGRCHDPETGVFIGFGDCAGTILPAIPRT
ncbi:Fumarylacetoacetase [Testicularia cyperi]|uniref:Fumarylacetoacetase n=1 Tax=Testicularia cyperi TaxID=1882483 RepID=A0A317XGG1_9BASI|nr:Fumarylacetoacetase [Testicularia cyperi]